MSDPRTHVYANNAVSLLAVAIDDNDTVVNVTPGDGALFPSLGAGEIFKVTLQNVSTGDIEICNATARSVNAITVERGQEGTTAIAWGTGTLVHNRVTAETLEHLEENAAAGSGAVDSIVAGDNITVDATDPANPIVSATGGGSSANDSEVLRFTAQYAGSGTSYSLSGIVTVQTDTSGGSEIGAFVPSGTKGQALPRILGKSGVSSAGVGVDFYSPNPFYRAVSGSGTGGFKFDALVMLESFDDTQCVLFGFAPVPNNAMFNNTSEPTDYSTFVAFTKNSTDTELQFTCRNGGAASKTALTGVSVAALVNHLLHVHIEATATEILYTLTDMETGDVLADGSTSTEMPAEDTQLYVHLAAQTNESDVTPAEVKLAFFKYSVEVAP